MAPNPRRLTVRSPPTSIVPAIPACTDFHSGMDHDSLICASASARVAPTWTRTSALSARARAECPYCPPRHLSATSVRSCASWHRRAEHVSQPWVHSSCCYRNSWRHLMTATNSIPGIPETGEPRRLGFAQDSTVDVRELDSTTWETLRPLIYRGNTDDFVVPEHEQTDFASVPRMFAWFLPRYGRYTKAAILHDHLWRVAVPNGLSRLDADGIFRQAM